MQVPRAWRACGSTIYFIAQALNDNLATRGAWETIHALSYHSYATDFDTIVNETISLHQQFNKPVWITEIASGADSSAAANLGLMQRFVPWANSQPWIERYFWNQAVRYEKQKGDAALCDAEGTCAHGKLMCSIPHAQPQAVAASHVAAAYTHCTMRSLPFAPRRSLRSKACVLNDNMCEAYCMALY